MTQKTEIANLDKLRFKLLSIRVDVSVFTEEFIDWKENLDLIVRGFTKPSNEPEDDGSGLSMTKKFDLGLISEEEYYGMSSTGYPERPKIEWQYVTSVIDLETVKECHAYDKKNDKTIAWLIFGGYRVVDMPVDSFLELILEYRERKKDQGILMNTLSEKR